MLRFIPLCLVAALVWAGLSQVPLPSLVNQAAAAEQLSFDQRGARMQFHMVKCAEILGFDFDSVLGLGPHDLAPGEQDWRDCAYVGIEKFMMPNTTVPQLYQQLILEDKAMSKLVLDGKLSRKQRAERIRALVATIETFEVTHLVTSDPDLTPDEMNGIAAIIRNSVAGMRYLALTPEPI